MDIDDEFFIKGDNTPNSDGKIGTDCGYILIPKQNINYDYIKNELSGFDWVNDMDAHLIIVNILTLSAQHIIDSVSEGDRKNHLNMIIRDIFKRENRKPKDGELLKDKCYEIINSIKKENFILPEDISDNDLYNTIKEKYMNSEIKEFILYIRNILKYKFEELPTKDISYIVERVNTIAYITSNKSPSPNSDFLNLYQNAIEYMGFLLQRYDEYSTDLMTYFSCIIDAVINSNTTKEERDKMRENIDCDPLINNISNNPKDKTEKFVRGEKGINEYMDDSFTISCDSESKNNNQMDNYRLPEDDNDKNIIYKMVKKTFDETNEEEFKLYMKNVLLNKCEDINLTIINEIVYKINFFRHISTNRYYTVIKWYTDLQEYLNSLYVKDDWLSAFCSSIVDIILTSKENTDSKNISWGVKHDEDKEEHKFFPGEYEKPIENNNRSEIRACQVNGGYYGIVTNIDMNDTFKNYENGKMSIYDTIKKNFDEKTREEFYFYMTQELKSICPQIDKDELLRITSNIDSYHDLDKHIYSELYEKTYNGIFQFIDTVCYKKRIDPTINKKIKIKCKTFIDVISDSMKNKNIIKIKGEINMDKVLQPRNRIEMIDSFLNDFRDFLITKNKNYGDSALKPINVFNKLDASNSITVRIDDKLSRIINSDELRENDCQDLFGYLILYCISEELYYNNDITAPEDQKTEDKINVFMNVFRREIKEKYIDLLKNLIDAHHPFAKLTVSEKIGIELDNLIFKLKGSKKLVKDDIFLFMILLVSIILENNWTDMKKFID